MRVLQLCMYAFFLLYNFSRSFWSSLSLSVTLTLSFCPSSISLLNKWFKGGCLFFLFFLPWHGAPQRKQPRQLRGPASTNFCHFFLHVFRFTLWSEIKIYLLMYFFFFFIYSPPRPRVLHYLYSIKVRSAAPQNTLWGGPAPIFEPGMAIYRQGH